MLNVKGKRLQQITPKANIREANIQRSVIKRSKYTPQANNETNEINEIKEVII